eukprot:304572_1
MSDYLRANNLYHLDHRTNIIIYGYVRQLQPFLFFDIASEIISMILSYVDHHFILDRGWYEWNVDATLLQKMIDANSAQFFISDPFKIAGLNWCLTTYPNGTELTNIGSFKLNLGVLSIPSSWKSIFVLIRLYNPESCTSLSRIVTIATDKKFCGWDNDCLFLQEVKDLQSNQLTLGVYLQIVQITLHENDSVFYKQPIQYNPLETQTFEWKINKSLMKKMKIARYEKRFDSPLFNNMWHLAIYPNGKNNVGDVLVLLCLCALPMHPKLTVHWNICCPELDMEQMYMNEFNISELFDWGWGDGHLSFDDFKNLDKITFRVEINYAKEAYMATMKWNQYVKETEGTTNDTFDYDVKKEDKLYYSDIELQPRNIRERDDAINMQNVTIVEEIKKIMEKLNNIENIANNQYNDQCIHIVIKKSHLMWLIVVLFAVIVGMVIQNQ